MGVAKFVRCILRRQVVFAVNCIIVNIPKYGIELSRIDGDRTASLYGPADLPI